MGVGAYIANKHAKPEQVTWAADLYQSHSEERGKRLETLMSEQSATSMAILGKNPLAWDHRGHIHTVWNDSCTVGSLVQAGTKHKRLSQVD